VLPVLGVPVASAHFNGLDSLLSIVQMPRGVPVGTMAIGPAGASNAALLATAIISSTRPALRQRLSLWRRERTDEVLADSDPRLPNPAVPNTSRPNTSVLNPSVPSPPVTGPI
jgi:5-(carboxyamino)imidazole ribonucleotide mutase